jgi:hypothetical protein
MIERSRGPRWAWLLVLLAVVAGVLGGVWLYGAVGAV